MCINELGLSTDVKKNFSSKIPKWRANVENLCQNTTFDDNFAINTDTLFLQTPLCATWCAIFSDVARVAVALWLRRQGQKPIALHKEIFEKMLCLTGRLVWVIGKNVT